MALFSFSLTMFFLLFIVAVNSSGYDFAMVIDAGSTHSTLFVYQFPDRVSSTSTPPESSPKQVNASSSLIPIAKLTSQSQSNQLITNLTNFAKYILASYSDHWNEYPIYLKATAGMRVLPNDEREEILNYIRNSFLNETINPFRFYTTQAIIASGEEEATFDWLAVNAIYNKLVNNNDDQSTYGALDLGGQSTQIAFAAEPSGNILADFTAVRLWETTHRLYTHSFLQYGTVAIEERVAQLSYNKYHSVIDGITYNPCLNNGTNITYTVILNDGTEGVDQQFGSSSNNPYGCRDLLREFLYNETKCLTYLCSINGQYQPTLPDNMTFVAFSAFAYATMNLGLPDNINLYDFYYNVTLNLCNLTLVELRIAVPELSGQYLQATCRLNTYIYMLLHEGYGFSLNDTNIMFRIEHDGAEITWTQGSILRDSNWLPYTLEFRNNDALNDEGKMYRSMTYTLISILVVFILCVFYLICKSRKPTPKNGYSSMEVAKNTGS